MNCELIKLLFRAEAISSGQGQPDNDEKEHFFPVYGGFELNNCRSSNSLDRCTYGGSPQWCNAIKTEEDERQRLTWRHLRDENLSNFLVDFRLIYLPGVSTSKVSLLIHSKRNTESISSMLNYSKLKKNYFNYLWIICYFCLYFDSDIITAEISPRLVLNKDRGIFFSPNHNCINHWKFFPLSQ